MAYQKKENKTNRQGEGGGKPPMFKDEKELQAKVDSYFKDGYRVKEITTSTGTVLKMPAITVTDLAIYLGFASRQSIYDYTEKEKFAYIIKRALLFIEREYEERLSFANSPTGAIFALKNMGWKDKSEVDSNVNVKDYTFSSNLEE